MIYKKKWTVVFDNLRVAEREGWFLFGVVPLYVRDVWNDVDRRGYRK